MKFNIVFIAFIFIIPFSGFCQSGPPNTKEAFDAMYKKRIEMEHIAGVYIPVDLAEAFKELNKKIDKTSKDIFLSVADSVAAKKLHFSLGRWMIVNWSFYEGSRYAAYLKKLGVTHPDDMAQFTMIAYHRYLRKKEIKSKELAQSFIEKRKAVIEAKKASGEVIETGTRKVEKETLEPKK